MNNFTFEETNLLCIYNTGSRTGLIDALTEMRGELSPEEAELLQRMTDASGMTKQDYLIERALCREVTVIPNKRMQRYMEEGMLFVYKELRRIESGDDIPEELADLACMLGGIFAGLGREIDEKPRQSEAGMIMGMVR